MGVSLESGRTDLNGVQIQFSGERPYSAETDLTMSLGYTYASTEVPGQPGHQTVADRFTASIDLSHNVARRWVLLIRGETLRDPVAQIRYRLGQMDGFGVRLGDKHVQLRVVPGLAFLDDDKGVVSEKGFHVHYGIYEDLAATLSPAWTLSQYVSGSRNFKNERDYLLAFDTKLTGAITKRIGIQLEYIYDFERILPPGVDPEYQKTTAGVQIKF